MIKLFRDIWKGQISGHFEPLVHGKTEMRAFESMWFSAKSAGITPILKLETHRALITTFPDISLEVSFSAILGTFGLVTSEAVGFWRCGFRLNVAHISLYIHTRNKKHIISS